MRTRNFLLRFSIIFALALLVNSLVTLCWNYFIEKAGWTVDWQTSLIMACVLAFVIPFTEPRTNSR